MAFDVWEVHLCCGRAYVCAPLTWTLSDLFFASPCHCLKFCAIYGLCRPFDSARFPYRALCLLAAFQDIHTCRNTAWQLQVRRLSLRVQERLDLQETRDRLLAGLAGRMNNIASCRQQVLTRQTLLPLKAAEQSMWSSILGPQKRN